MLAVVIWRWPTELYNSYLPGKIFRKTEITSDVRFKRAASFFKPKTFARRFKIKEAVSGYISKIENRRRNAKKKRRNSR